VVADDQLPLAITSVSGLVGLEACHDVNSCLAVHNRYTPPASFHLHVRDTKLFVGLYTQSETLWFLPRFDHTLVFPPTLQDHPHFTFASDRTTLPPYRDGRGAGFFTIHEPPVLVPRSFILLEALMRIHARDSAKQVGAFAIQMICYVAGYVDSDGYLDVTRLSEPLRTFYQRFQKGDQRLAPWTIELKEALGVPIEEKAWND
jgi:hypothetical protein